MIGSARPSANPTYSMRYWFGRVRYRSRYSTVAAATPTLAQSTAPNTQATSAQSMLSFFGDGSEWSASGASATIFSPATLFCYGSETLGAWGYLCNPRGNWRPHP